MKIVLCGIAFVVFAPVVACGMDVPPVAVSDFDSGAAEVSWLWLALFSQTGAALVAWVASTARRWLIERRQLLESSWQAKMYDFVAFGVQETYTTMVRAIKEGKDGDGRLTEAEKREAVRKAIACAQEYAFTCGIDLLKEVGPQMLELLVERVIGDRKAGKILALPFPELAPR